MDLTPAEYERLIELQAAALGCAERSLQVIRDAHRELKKAYEAAQTEIRELKREVRHG